MRCPARYPAPPTCRALASWLTCSMKPIYHQYPYLTVSLSPLHKRGDSRAGPGVSPARQRESRGHFTAPAVGQRLTWSGSPGASPGQARAAVSGGPRSLFPPLPFALSLPPPGWQRPRPRLIVGQDPGCSRGAWTPPSPDLITCCARNEGPALFKKKLL